MRNYLLIIISLVIFTSCGRVIGKRVSGNGNVTTTVRQGTGFSEIDVSSNVDVYVKQDSAFSIRVVTDENIHEYVNINNSGSRLDISLKKGFRVKPTNGLKVYVSAPVFSKFEASGACNYFTESQVRNNGSVNIRLSGACDADMDINSPMVMATLSGAGSLKLRGQARTLEIKGTGSSKVKCADMMAENVKVNITGAGDAEVFASVSLDVRVTGAGSVKYKGNPSINQTVSGSGSVKRLN